MRPLLLAALLLAPIPLPAVAAADTDAPKAWALSDFVVYEAEDRNKPEEKRDVEYSGKRVHTTDASTPGAAFFCSAKYGLSVTFSLAPVDFYDEGYFASSRKLNGRGGRMHIEGEPRGHTQRFIVRPKLKLAQPVNPDLAFKAVSALYTRKSMTIDVDGFEMVDLLLPPPDEAFEAFVEACPSFEKDA